MVAGLELFKEHFSDYADQYMLIGGTACSILMEEAGEEFRSTRDLDIVLHIEALSKSFVKAFQEFVEQGGYEIRQKNDGAPQLYRYAKPASEGYPTMLELFSRKPDILDIPDSSRYTPIPMEDEGYSLSAILMDDNYYEFIKGGTRQIDGISIIDAAHLIPMKVKAYLDLAERRSNGENVSNNDVQKHKRDVFRLLTIIDPASRVQLSASMRADLNSFVSAMEQEAFDPKSIGLKAFTLNQLLTVLTDLYSENV